MHAIHNAPCRLLAYTTHTFWHHFHAAPAQGQHEMASYMGSLEAHCKQLPFQAVAASLVLSCLLADCLAICARHQGLQDATPDAAALLKAMQQVAVNGIAVVPSARRSEQDRLGLAVYPVASLLNHSCVPNTSLYFVQVSGVALTMYLQT